MVGGVGARGGQEASFYSLLPPVEERAHALHAHGIDRAAQYLVLEPRKLCRLPSGTGRTSVAEEKEGGAQGGSSESLATEATAVASDRRGFSGDRSHADPARFGRQASKQARVRHNTMHLCVLDTRHLLSLLCLALRQQRGLLFCLDGLRVRRIARLHMRAQTTPIA